MSRKLQGKSINKAFDDALELLGGIKGMSAAIGISGAHVRRLRVGKYNLRLEHAMKIERATGGKVKAGDLATIQLEDDKK